MRTKIERTSKLDLLGVIDSPLSSDAQKKKAKQLLNSLAEPTVISPATMTLHGSRSVINCEPSQNKPGSFDQIETAIPYEVVVSRSFFDRSLSQITSEAEQADVAMRQRSFAAVAFMHPEKKAEQEAALRDFPTSLPFFNQILETDEERAIRRASSPPQFGELLRDLAVGRS